MVQTENIVEEKEIQTDEDHTKSIISGASSTKLKQGIK